MLAGVVYALQSGGGWYAPEDRAVWLRTLTLEPKFVRAVQLPRKSRALVVAMSEGTNSAVAQVVDRTGAVVCILEGVYHQDDACVRFSGCGLLDQVFTIGINEPCSP